MDVYRWMALLSCNALHQHSSSPWYHDAMHVHLSSAHLQVVYPVSTTSSSSMETSWTGGCEPLRSSSCCWWHSYCGRVRCTYSEVSTIIIIDHYHHHLRYHHHHLSSSSPSSLRPPPHPPPPVGNHETTQMNSVYGFQKEVLHKYGKETLHMFRLLFMTLPVGE